MARRNKKKTKTNAFIFPAPFAGVVVLLSTLALGYVWLGCKCEELGEELKRLEQDHKELVKRYVNEEYRWTRLKAPHSIAKALERHNIVMSWPRGDQVIRLSDDDMDFARPGKVKARALEETALARVVMNE